MRAQILYLGKFWLFTYEPKCCKPIRLQDSVEKKSMNQLIFGMQINIQEKHSVTFFVISIVRAQILYLGKFWLFTYEPKCCKPIRLQDSVEKKSMNQLIFGMQINIQET